METAVFARRRKDIGKPEKPGNPLSKYERRKELTREEQREYQGELLKRELMKKKQRY